jgi:hypothetical protein
MPPSGESLKPDTVIDISHESLMRVWNRLRIWTDEEARSAGTYRRLSETASLESVGKASLWTGPDLAGALAWLEDEKPESCWAERYAPGFAEAIAFLKKSEDAQVTEQKRQLDEALEKARTKERYARAIALLSVALVLAVVLAGMFYYRSAVAAHEKEKAKLEESQKATRSLLTSLAVAVQPFAVDKHQREDDRKIHQSFEALNHISAITATASPEHHTKIQYFKKATDSQKLATALDDLGFTVIEETARNPRETNCIWYGSGVPENDVKLVAFALMRGGIDLQGVQPEVGIEPEVIQVGHNTSLQDQPPFTPDLVSRTPLGKLRRTEAKARLNVTGTIIKLDPKAQKGWIQGPDGAVYFQFSPNPPPRPFNVGDVVTFTVYYGKQLYGEDVVARPEIPQPGPTTARSN